MQYAVGDLKVRSSGFEYKWIGKHVCIFSSLALNAAVMLKTLISRWAMANIMSKLNAATCHESRVNKSMDFDYCYGSMNDHQGVSQKNDVECNMHVWLWLSNISMFSL